VRVGKQSEPADQEVRPQQKKVQTDRNGIAIPSNKMNEKEDHEEKMLKKERKKETQRTAETGVPPKSMEQKHLPEKRVELQNRGRN